MSKAKEKDVWSYFFKLQNKNYDRIKYLDSKLKWSPKYRKELEKL